MKALIFNSGKGTRMGNLTEDKPKCMVKLLNGETIFERQLRILGECGITEFIITTGSFEKQIIDLARERFPHLNFTFVYNPDYDTTNYIYSMYLAEKYLDDDILLLHGDLVFDKLLVNVILNSTEKSLCLYSPSKPLPEKDFKCRLKNGFLSKVSVNIFTDDCYAFQPFYKLSHKVITAWKNEVHRFIIDGKKTIYAEDALNHILVKCNIMPMSYDDYYINEIDNEADFKKVSAEIVRFDYRQQEIFIGASFEQTINKILSENYYTKIFLVGSKKRCSLVSTILDKYLFSYTCFDGFNNNPKYEEIQSGALLFTKENCDFIISVGGGSSIDTAKGIKLLTASGEENFLSEKYFFSSVKHLAIPTTAGTGSESTHFAVFYNRGIKVSARHISALPDYVVLEPEFLKTLPDYYMKSALLDSFCQAIESYWSKQSNEESRIYARKCIRLIMKNYNAYLKDNTRASDILKASNYSGKAINLTYTTAPHGMSYLLTTLYGISHGQAVGLILPYVWEYMYNNIGEISDGKLLNDFLELTELMECSNITSAIEFMKRMYLSMDFPKLPDLTLEDIDKLSASVNLERMKNNPFLLHFDDIKNIYTKIIRSTLHTTHKTT